jgi:hypothetical protein
MNRFGEIADELTELIEELDQPGLSRDARALKAALQRAFAKACEAERAMRLKEQAEPAEALTPKPRRRAAVGAAGAPQPAAERGVVIPWPRAWRVAGSAARRLDD